MSYAIAPQPERVDADDFGRPLKSGGDLLDQNGPWHKITIRIAKVSGGTSLSQLLANDVPVNSVGSF